MRLPVWPMGDNDVIDELAEFVCHARTTKDRDIIIRAINGQEKLYNLLQGAYGYIPEGDCMQKAIKQALKESEKK